MISQFVNTPLLVIVETKQPDFEGGWGQSPGKYVHQASATLLVTNPHRIFENLDWVFNECEKQVG